MPFTIYFLLGLVLVVVLAALTVIILFRRLSIPCPAWLGWVVELNSPVFKTYTAGEIIRHARLQSGMKVLDLGCGPGRLTIPAAREVAPSGMVTAFDLQAAMLRRVRQKAGREKIVNIEYVQGAAGQGKIGKNVFDRVLLSTVLGEIPEKEKALMEIFESLKSGGLLSITEVVMDPHYQSRPKVVQAALACGFKEVEFFGSRLAYTINFERP